MSADNDVLDRLTEVIQAGGAVCLIGAGFATAGTDHEGNAVPSSQSLIDEIKNAVGVDKSEDVSLPPWRSWLMT